VRLLTNLETNKEKLLRIMLVGQPELAELLARQDLRQLAQRITARYHLTPLSAEETVEYIAHRLQVAGGARDIFTAASVKRIHKYAGGIPRLVNVLCDRALLGAYAKSVRQVTPPLVEQAAEEVFGTGIPKPAAAPKAPVPLAVRENTASIVIPAKPAKVRTPINYGDAAHRVAERLRRWAWPWLAIPAVILALALIYVQLMHSDEKGSAAAEAAAGTSPGFSVPMATAAQAKPETTDADVVTKAAAEPTTSIAAAKPAIAANPVEAAYAPLGAVVQRLAQLWQPGYQLSRGEKACVGLHRNRLECLKGNAELSDLTAMNVPAVLTISSGGGLHYVLLRSLSNDTATLIGPKGSVRVPTAALDPLWTGEYLLLWARETDETSIGPEIRGEPILWLRKRLAARLGKPVGNAEDPLWDEELRKAVSRVQTAIGVRPDGVAGPRTLLALSSRPATGRAQGRSCTG
jgi:general secretion pathway protein A